MRKLYYNIVVKFNIFCDLRFVKYFIRNLSNIPLRLSFNLIFNLKTPNFIEINKINTFLKKEITYDLCGYE